MARRPVVRPHLARNRKPERSEPRSRSRRLLGWLAVTLATALVGAVVTVNTDVLKKWFSEQNPLDIEVTTSDEMPRNGFDVVVTDSGKLPANIGSIDDCPGMWKAGLAAGGVRIDETAARAVLQGKATDGVTIVDVRAKITKRGPAQDGTRLTCPSAGGQDPIGLGFDLTDGDTAPATRFDNDKGPVNQFVDGFVINVAQKESVPLAIEAKLPDDSVTWHVEADVLIGGERRTTVIANFHSPGRRDDDNYRAGHLAGVATTDWGIDANAVSANGKLRLDAVEFPLVDRMDIYQPGGSEFSFDGPAYRFVRVDGRKLLAFNPPGVAAIEPPQVGRGCDRGNDFGTVQELTQTEQTTTTRNGGSYTTTTFSLHCRGSSLDERQTFRATTVRGSDVVVAYLSSELDPKDVAVADRLLNEVVIATSG